MNPDLYTLISHGSTAMDPHAHDIDTADPSVMLGALTLLAILLARMMRRERRVRTEA